MRIALICAGFIVVLWPMGLGNNIDVSGRRGDRLRIDGGLPTVLSPVVRAPLKRTVAAPLRTAAEADHAPAQASALAAEPLAKVPIDDVCATLVAAADASGLPALFFLRLIWQESRFEQHAVSSAGALGVAQFMPAVAAERGLEHPFDPRTALWASAQFLRDHYRTFGNLGLAAMAYNAGAQRVLDWLARRGKLPDETRRYVTIITGQPPEQWIKVQPLELALDMPRRAPCGQVGGLSERAGVRHIDVQLQEPIRKIIETAKAEAERKAREAAAAKARQEKEQRAKEAKARKERHKHAKAAAARAKACGKVKQARAAKPAHKRADKKPAARARLHHRDRLAVN
jgi:Transglycosylase SLT domain